MSIDAAAHERPDNSQSIGPEAIEAAKLNTHQELRSLSAEITHAAIPESALAYIQEKCPQEADQAAILDYLHSVKVTEFGGLDNIPEPFWPAVLDDCIRAVQENIQIAHLNTQIKTEKESNKDRMSTIDSLRERITGNLTGSDKAEQLSDLIRRVESQEGFPEDEKQAALVHLRHIRSTISEMAAVFPDEPKRDAFIRIVNTSSLDLGTASLTDIFTPILRDVEASGVFSEDDKRRLRTIVTGSQAQDILEKTILDENGNEVTAWPKDNPMEVRPGVTMYADNNANQYLRMSYNDHITEIDMSGVRGEVLGKYLEACSFIHDVERYDATGLFQSIYQIDFNLMGNEGFDMGKINQILDIMGKIFGGLEHADGDIRRAGERRGLIRHFARLLNKSGSVTGFKESQSDTNDVVHELGLRYKDGSPNWKQIDRLGEFTQITYLTGDAGFEDLKTYLAGTNK